MSQKCFLYSFHMITDLISLEFPNFDWQNLGILAKARRKQKVRPTLLSQEGPTRWNSPCSVEGAYPPGSFARVSQRGGLNWASGHSWRVNGSLGCGVDTWIYDGYMGLGGPSLQSWPKYFRQTVVFVLYSTLWEKFNFYFSTLFC